MRSMGVHVAAICFALCSTVTAANQLSRETWTTWEFFTRATGDDVARCIAAGDVQCDLMGDVRHIRNAIIHENSEIGEKVIDKLKMLPSIWKPEPGNLTITENMVHALMEQIDAIRVRVAEKH